MKDAAFVEVAARVAEAVKTRANPASFDDHYSQVRQFWLGMTRPEKEHIVLAYTFELARCYEQVIKERQLLALANIDTGLCEKVAAGLGLAVPEPSIPLLDLAPSPALSQVGGTWPTDGRMIGIVVDPDGDLDGVETVVAAVKAAGMVPLVIAPHGGKLPTGTPIQRSFGGTRSVEFDAVLLAGAPVPAADAMVVRDTKAAAAGAPLLDPRVVLLLQECFRHAKVIGAWGAGIEALQIAGILSDEAGVVIGDDATQVLTAAQGLLGSHRVWERFGQVLA